MIVSRVMANGLLNLSLKVNAEARTMGRAFIFYSLVFCFLCIALCLVALTSERYTVNNYNTLCHFNHLKGWDWGPGSDKPCSADPITEWLRSEGGS